MYDDPPSSVASEVACSESANEAARTTLDALGSRPPRGFVGSVVLFESPKIMNRGRINSPSAQSTRKTQLGGPPLKLLARNGRSALNAKARSGPSIGDSGLS